MSEDPYDLRAAVTLSLETINQEIHGGRYIWPILPMALEDLVSGWWGWKNPIGRAVSGGSDGSNIMGRGSGIGRMGYNKRKGGYSAGQMNSGGMGVVERVWVCYNMPLTTLTLWYG